MNNFICYGCGFYKDRLAVEFNKQSEAKQRYLEKHKLPLLPESVLGLCADCASKMNYKAKKNTIAKYGGNSMIDEEKVMSPTERKGRLLFKAVGLLERIITQIEKLPEK